MERGLGSFVISIFILCILVFPAMASDLSTEIKAETQAITTEEGPQITIGGEMRMRGRYTDNISTTESEPIETDSYAWYDSRIRLFVDAKVSPGLQGYLMLESGSGTKANYDWGTLNSKQLSLSIIEAWILYKGSGLLGVPAGIKIGHMFLSLGERQFLDHTKFGDDAIVFFIDPNAKTHIELLTVKFREGEFAVNTDDFDAYIGSLLYSFDNHNIAIDYTYLNNSSNLIGTSSNFKRLKFHNVGLHVKGSIVKGLNYIASTDIQFGKVYNETLSRDERFSGYGLLLKLKYKVNDNINIRASFAMGSGDDDLSDDNHKEFQTTRLYRNETPLYSYVYESQVDTAWMDQVFEPYDDGAKNRGNGIANTTYYNVGIDISLMKSLKTFIDGYKISLPTAVFSAPTKILSFSNISLPDISFFVAASYNPK